MFYLQSYYRRNSKDIIDLNFITEIIENVLYILWRHIEYYYIHCVPSEEDAFELDIPRTPSVRARRLQGKSSMFVI